MTNLVKVKKLGKAPIIRVASFFDGKNGKILESEVKKRGYKRKELVSLATSHYRNALGQVKMRLSHPLEQHGIHGGSRAIGFYDGAGRSRRIITGRWPALNYEYAKRRPRSIRTWKKRGRLSQYVNRDLKVGQAKATILRTRTKVASRKDRVRISYLIGFSSLPNNVVNTLVASSFVHGNDGPAKGFKARGLNRESSELMGYPEAARRVFRRGHRRAKGTLHPGRELRASLGGAVNRPFVAKLSGRLGREMHREIRKL